MPASDIEKVRTIFAVISTGNVDLATRYIEGLRALPDPRLPHSAQ